MISFVSGTIGRLERVLDPVAKVMHRISAVMLLIMPLPVFIDVVVRFAYAGEVPGKIELEEFILSIVIFFGLAFVQVSGGHIKIDLLTSRFPKWIGHTLDSGIYTIATILFGLMSSHLFIEGIKKYNNHEASFALDIPVFIFRYLAAFGVAVLTFVVLLELFRTVKHVLEANKGGWLLLSIPLGLVLILGPVLGFAPHEMEGATAGYLGMALMFVLLFLGMPVGFGMTLAGLLGMIVVYGSAPPALGMLGIATYEKAASYMLTVVPLFILMGQFAYHSGISADLFNTGQVWMGRLPGGLAMSSVAGCAGFAAVCGDSLATAVTMGTVAIPSMKEQKYDMSLATGSLAAGGTLGILIPPSAAFIFYAIVTEESIGQLFIAGIVPGLLLTLLFMAIIYIRARLNPALAPMGAKSTLKEKIISLKGVIGMLALFLLIMGGILGGLFSPVEGGAVGAVGAFVYAGIKGRLSVAMIRQSLFGTLAITCKLLMILIGVGILGYFLAATRLPFVMAEFITGLDVNRYVIFTGVIVLFMLLGCVLNVIPMILLVLPTIFPTITALGFNPIWFGVVTVLTMEMGQITPPIGVNVFAIGSVVTDVPLEHIFRGILPFFICMILCIVLLTLFPQIALFLPDLLF